MENTSEDEQGGRQGQIGVWEGGWIPHFQRGRMFPPPCLYCQVRKYRYVRVVERKLKGKGGGRTKFILTFPITDDHQICILSPFHYVLCPPPEVRHHYLSSVVFSKHHHTYKHLQQERRSLYQSSALLEERKQIAIISLFFSFSLSRSTIHTSSSIPCLETKN